MILFRWSIPITRGRMIEQFSQNAAYNSLDASFGIPLGQLGDIQQQLFGLEPWRWKKLRRSRSEMRQILPVARHAQPRRSLQKTYACFRHPLRELLDSGRIKVRAVPRGMLFVDVLGRPLAEGGALGGAAP